MGCYECEEDFELFSQVQLNLRATINRYCAYSNHLLYDIITTAN